MAERLGRAQKIICRFFYEGVFKVVFWITSLRVRYRWFCLQKSRVSFSFSQFNWKKTQKKKKVKQQYIKKWYYWHNNYFDTFYFRIALIPPLLNIFTIIEDVYFFYWSIDCIAPPDFYHISKASISFIDSPPPCRKLSNAHIFVFSVVLRRIFFLHGMDFSFSVFFSQTFRPIHYSASFRCKKWLVKY